MARMLFNILGVAALAFLFTAATPIHEGSPVLGPGAQEFPTLPERNTMAVSMAKAAQKTAIPFIDAAQPAQFETATFALG